MSKMPMAWHEQCLENFRNSVVRRREDAARMAADLATAERELSLYEEQVAVAKMRGLDGFDRDRLLIKKSA